jgi:hypothetical protein
MYICRFTVNDTLLAFKFAFPLPFHILPFFVLFGIELLMSPFVLGDSSVLKMLIELTNPVTFVPFEPIEGQDVVDILTITPALFGNYNYETKNIISKIIKLYMNFIYYLRLYCYLF